MDIAAISVPTLGRIVHFVFENAGGQLVTRPAIIVATFHKNTGGQIVWDFRVNLQVFTDGSNDGQSPTLHKTSVPHSLSHTEKETWHWPERA